MRLFDIIHKKRLGRELSEEEIRFFVGAYGRGEVPDAQAAALVMAICIQGMSVPETAVLTDAMLRSGEVLDLSRFGTRSVDKHSTGGVGDKTTLVVAPIVAALGGKLAKMSGRSLGYTGGTLDKLESIPGFRTDLRPSEFMAQVERIGLALAGQSVNLAPADKKLYALRDLTATVDSVPLIASSVMSKKLAAGAHSIVLDVKLGSGAFMKTEEEAEELAETMIAIGSHWGRKVKALITDMDAPLGACVGNTLEVAEAVRILTGSGCPDLKELCVALAAAMASLSLGLSPEEAENRALEAIESGAAFEKMKEWVGAQGGDVSVLEDTERLPKAPVRHRLRSEQTGFLSRMDAERIGICAARLADGGQDKRTDLSAGVVLTRKRGDFVKEGEELAVLHTGREEALPEAEELFRAALTFSETKPVYKPLIRKIL